ncbi:hypothetical protein M2165_004491 [Variovorax sp. TBS-050B]|uniref:hypothetical protein n=1 Tax=Variovorax sp. TBS-050B TaxID=2940551 RepID=UPI002475A2C8|nr:hypothetical protein [Variovorax sp. TBS-050B]MDH6594602.1 hypothetical protein [Variovorax sp. TBS-050B]
MSQVTIYLDDESEKAARAAAAAANLSLSRWFAQFAERERQRQKADWQSVFAAADEQKAAWDVFPLTEEMHKDLPPDTPRESL